MRISAFGADCKNIVTFWSGLFLGEGKTLFTTRKHVPTTGHTIRTQVLAIHYSQLNFAIQVQLKKGDVALKPSGYVWQEKLRRAEQRILWKTETWGFYVERILMRVALNNWANSLMRCEISTHAICSAPKKLSGVPTQFISPVNAKEIALLSWRQFSPSRWPQFFASTQKHFSCEIGKRFRPVCFATEGSGVTCELAQQEHCPAGPQQTSSFTFAFRVVPLVRKQFWPPKQPLQL